MYKKLFTDKLGAPICFNCVPTAKLKNNCRERAVPITSLQMQACNLCGGWTKNYIKKALRENLYHQLLQGHFSNSDGTVTKMIEEMFLDKEQKETLSVCAFCLIVASPKHVTFATDFIDGYVYCINCFMLCKNCEKSFSSQNRTRCCGSVFCKNCYRTHKTAIHGPAPSFNTFDD